MKREPGTRVGAVLSATPETAKFLGYGVYQGDEIPKGHSIVHPVFGVSLKRLKLASPKILLESGDVIWGCECWWGPEEQIRQLLDGRIIEMVKMQDHRVPENPKMIPVMRRAIKQGIVLSEKVLAK